MEHVLTEGGQVDRLLIDMLLLSYKQDPQVLIGFTQIWAVANARPTTNLRVPGAIAEKALQGEVLHICGSQ